MVLEALVEGKTMYAILNAAIMLTLCIIDVPIWRQVALKKFSSDF